MNAPGLKITNFHYSTMKMPEPDLSMRDYPKWVRVKGYPDAVAKDAAEEAELLARPVREVSEAAKPVAVPKEPLVNPAKAGAAQMPPPRTLAGPNEERDILIQIAQEKGIKIDKRWKIERIRHALEQG